MSLVLHADGRERQVRRGTWAPGVQGHCGDLTAKLGGAGGGGEAGQPGAAAHGLHPLADCSFVCSANLVGEAAAIPQGTGQAGRLQSARSRGARKAPLDLIRHV